MMDNSRFTPGNKYVVIMGGDREQDNLNGEYKLVSINEKFALVTTQDVLNKRAGREIMVPVAALYTHDELSRIMNPWWEPGY